MNQFPAAVVVDRKPTAYAGVDAMLSVEQIEAARPKILRYFHSRNVFGDHAEDLTQVTVLRMWQKRGSHDPLKGSIWNWAYRIATNVLIDDKRHAARRASTVSIEEEIYDTDVTIAEHLADQSDPFAEIFAVPMSAELRKAIGAISSEQRESVLLADVERLSYDEIAERTGVPVGTVRSRIHRGRHALRSLLGDDFLRDRAASLSSS